MLFLTVLVVATVAAWLVDRPGTWRSHARWGMAAAMIVAGIAHLVRPEPFLQHLPSWTPAPEAMVALTGIIEIGLGILLVGPWLERVWAGRLLAAYLVAVFPANVYVAVAGIDVDGQPGGVYSWLRLPLQAVFVVWTMWSTRPELAVLERASV